LGSVHKVSVGLQKIDPWPYLGCCPGACAVQASWRVHVVPETTAKLAPAHRWLLWPSFPRQDVRRT